MAEIVRIGRVPGIGNPAWATYVSGQGLIVGGPSRITLIPSDDNRVGSNWIAGDALNPWDACFIYKGKAYQSLADGTTRSIDGQTITAVQKAKCDGFAALQTSKGEAVTLYGGGIEANYVLVSDATGGVFTKDLYVSTTIAGGLADVQPTVTNPLARCAEYLGDGTIRNK